MRLLPFQAGIDIDNYEMKNSKEKTPRKEILDRGAYTEVSVRHNH
jgi:hypothetical protein